MADMRRMVHLYMIFKNKCVARNVHCASPSDMLQRKNMSLLKEAIETYTESEQGQLKSGLRNALYYLIVNFAVIHKTTCLVQERPEEHKKIEEFIEVFKLYQHAWFGTARYNLTKNRQLILRRPQELPSEEDVTTVKKYSLDKMNELLGDEFLIWSETEYVQLRDLVVCRLILFNARRVGEPSRLTLSEWEDAENGVWLDPQRRGNYDEDDAAFFKDLKITFQGGKGNKLVSVFFPADSHAALRKLSNLELRRSIGILDSNRYLFPCFHNSFYHVSGWHAVNKICLEAGIENPEKLTSTKMRHRASTIFAAEDVPEKDRALFYKHMGHTEEIKLHVYQAPLAEASLLKVGKQLMGMDGHPTSSHSATLQTRSKVITLSIPLEVSASSSSIASDEGSALVIQSRNINATLQTHSEVITLSNPLEVSASSSTNASDEGAALSIDPSSIQSRNIKDTRNESTRIQQEKKSKAPYTRWTPLESKKLLDYFSGILKDERIPSKPEIMQFMDEFPEIHHTWTEMRTKLDNEKRRRKNNCRKQLAEMEMS